MNLAALLETRVPAFPEHCPSTNTMACTGVLSKFSIFHGSYEGIWTKQTETLREAEFIADIVRTVIAALGFRETYFEVTIEED